MPQTQAVSQAALNYPYETLYIGNNGSQPGSRLVSCGGVASNVCIPELFEDVALGLDGSIVSTLWLKVRQDDSLRCGRLTMKVLPPPGVPS